MFVCFVHSLCIHVITYLNYNLLKKKVIFLSRYNYINSSSEGHLRGEISIIGVLK